MWVERRIASVTIRWFKGRFVGPRGSAKRPHQYLRQGKNYRYSLDQFKEAKPWELGAIGHAEDTFEPLRLRSTLLGVTDN